MRAEPPVRASGAAWNRLLADAGGGGEAGGLFGGDGADRRRSGEGGVFGVDCGRVIGAETELFERAAVGHQLGLPAVVGLILLHGRNRGCIPVAGGLAAEVVLADKSLLNLRGPLRINGLLPAEAVGSVRCQVVCPAPGSGSGGTVNV